MLLNSICMLDVACCSPRTTVLEAAHLMRQKHTGDLVVVDDGSTNEAAPLGVITDRDIVIEVLGKGLDPAVTLVSTLMRTPVVIANQGEDTSQALERMRAHGVRRLPVVSDSGALVGIVTVDDLVKRLGADATALVDVISREQTHEQRARR
jgi:CBS domain-containing protein